MTGSIRIPLCRHIRTNGTRCRSAAISGQDFCYFHVRLHKDHPAPLTAQQIVDSWREDHVEAFRKGGEDPMLLARAYPRQNEFNFPPLEDDESVQLAGSMLFHAVAQGKIHPFRAGILVKALQIVNSSLRKRPNTSPSDTAEVVRELDQNADGVALAPAGEPPTTQTE